MVLRQLTLNDFDETIDLRSSKVIAAVKKLSLESNSESRGAVFTRPEVVDFILDLSGYIEDKELHKKRLLEPSFGGGDFLLPAINRLLGSWQKTCSGGQVVEELADSIRAVELHSKTFSDTRTAVISLLLQKGISEQSATALADRWLFNGDFLLTPFAGQFDYIVGNPPYLRQEMIPAALIEEYRKRYQTIYDRADIYVPFIERSLSVLKKGGCLGFICSDRWIKNKYGGPLRNLVASNFHLKAFVDMVDTPAFHKDVIAYPAITIISNEPPGKTRIARGSAIEKEALSSLSNELLSPGKCSSGEHVQELAMLPKGTEPWLLETSDQMALIRRLEQEFPSLEEAACKVGIGVATGADSQFIGDFAALDIESDRKLPLVTTRDITSGEVNWLGLGVVNPFDDKDGLVNLSDYPRLKKYLEARKSIIANRHCAKKTPGNWYRTIDRICPAIAKKPKLLIPDIKGEAHIVYEPGNLYPHHNLYYIISEEWDLRALQAVLLSSITQSFIETYSTKMRGGYLRYQAQYLRRIRLPHWKNVSEILRQKLADAAIKRDINACNHATFELYGLTAEERSILGGQRN